MPCSLDSLLDVAKRLRLTPMIRYAIELEQDVTTANLSHAEYLAKLLHCEWKDATKKHSKDGCNRPISVMPMRALHELTGMQIAQSIDRCSTLWRPMITSDSTRTSSLPALLVAARLGWLTRLDTQLAWPDSELSTIAWLRCSRNTSVYALKTRQSAADSICRAWENLIC